ncbi:GIY-YIG nuclease family protein [Neptunomonas sp. CHC150]|uniref:GIY-YIG nuclease family protein n=1 Tax=Neptunomonas sp. CHC150 TaxID=2998324 RepID=UPI0025B00619|nr:GIY-YIG nuclease family protein [Neptunomonas sp. CHC150]MDN2660133.1 GIY-YIG nuclease family protein [Neptunomonas sp. CHC150]
MAEPSNKSKSNQELLAELGVEVKQEKKSARTPKEERIIAGFEEVQRFVDEHGRTPEHGESKDIFERLYATRLDQIRKQEECRVLVEPMDHQGLVAGGLQVAEPPAEYNSDEELLAQLGIDAPIEGDITYLKHVKSQSEKERAKAEEIGQRTPCKDFEKFKPLFDEVQDDIKSGKRKTLKFNKDGSVEEGNFFILAGQKAYIAEVGDEFIGTDGRKEYRLRVIFDNGVESNQLMRSLQKRLWEDDTGRRITDISMGPLFDAVASEDDTESGTIYVLRSKSKLPLIAQNRNVIHKIGVTSESIKKRVSNASLDPTYLMADVEIVASYELFNINRQKLEKILHRVFEPARLDIEINDRFGNPVKPREWFLVPLETIDQAVKKIEDGTIIDVIYDPKIANFS